MKDNTFVIRHFTSSSPSAHNTDYGIHFLSLVKSFSIRISLGPFAIGGDAPIYDLPLIELRRTGEVYLTFPDGVELSVGEEYRVDRPIGLSGDEYFFFGRPRETVAVVKVIMITGKTRAQVQVLSGSVIGGVSAEKLSKDPV
jgi:hypothetical protein